LCGFFYWFLLCGLQRELREVQRQSEQLDVARVSDMHAMVRRSSHARTPRAEDALFRVRLASGRLLASPREPTPTVALSALRRFRARSSPTPRASTVI
jgi:hypothetical protein